jgi:periplasmic divalent cation tolerance protein
MEKIYMVYVTFSSTSEAEKIAEKMVRDRLAACANIYDGIESFYWWEDKFQKDTEAVVKFKTREALLSPLEESIKAEHSYSCPCIVALPIHHASKDYQEWILRETSCKEADEVI